MGGHFEPDPGRARDPSSILAGCVERGLRAVLLEGDAVPSEFFDLSSRFAGELLQKLSTYGIRMAAVVPDRGAQSQPFQDFMREAERGRQFRFFSTRSEAVDWLEGA